MNIPDPNLLLAGLMLISGLILLLSGYSAAYALGGAGVLFALAGHSSGFLDIMVIGEMAPRLMRFFTNETVLSLPLFVLMGVLWDRANLHIHLFTALERFFVTTPGGLALATVICGFLLFPLNATLTAGVGILGVAALPSMLRAGYRPEVAGGAILTGGGVGALMPPALTLLFISDMLRDANITTQLAQGNFAPATLSLGEIMAAALLPALLVVWLYLAWFGLKVIQDPDECQPEANGRHPGFSRELLLALLPVMGVSGLLLLALVSGFADPLQAAAGGVLGALLLMLFYGEFSLLRLQEALTAAARTTTNLILLWLGAEFFLTILKGLGGGLLFAGIFAPESGSIFPLLIFIGLLLLTAFLVGIFPALFLLLPLFLPYLLNLDIEPLWLAVIVALTLSLAQNLPFLGANIFILKGISPPEVDTRSLSLGSLPLMGSKLLVMLLLFLAPATATWLPEQITALPDEDEGGYEFEISPENQEMEYPATEEEGFIPSGESE